MASVFVFDISADMPDAPAGACNPTKLHAEIDAAAIGPTLLSVNHDVVADECTITFDGDLSAGEETILHGDQTGPALGLLGDHDNTVDTPAFITSGVLLQEEGDGFNNETLSGNKTLVYNDADIQNLDPGGAHRDVILQEEAANKGRRIRLRNTADAAENLVVKNDGAGTIATLNQDEASWFVCSGTVWTHTGIETIALA